MSKIKLTDEQIEMAAKLTSLSRKTVINIVKGSTQRDAYKKAGGKAKNDKSIDTIVSRMLTDVKVKAFYNSLLNTAAEYAIMTKQDAIQILEESAKVKITDVCDFRNVKIGEDEDGLDVYQTVWTIKNSEDIPDHIARCIKSVTVTKDGPKIELHNGRDDIKQLRAMQGWDTAKKTEITGANGEALQLKADISSTEISGAIDRLMEKL